MGKDNFRDNFSGRLSRETQQHFERAESKFGTRPAIKSTRRALDDATFNRGPLAGRTGDPFKDDPFFNPWAKGGTFNP